MENRLQRWVLYDNQASSEIETDVYNYLEINPFVYTYGENGFTRLDYESAEVLQSDNLSDFPLNEQSILNKMEKGYGFKSNKGEKWTNEDK